MSRQTAIMISQETPVRNWVDEDIPFEDEYNITFCDTDLTYCVEIANRKGFFSEQSKMRKKIVGRHMQFLQLIFFAV